MANAQTDQLTRYIGRLIEHTCNAIGCSECPFSKCEVNRVQDEIKEIEEKKEIE